MCSSTGASSNINIYVVMCSDGALMYYSCILSAKHCICLSCRIYDIWTSSFEALFFTVSRIIIAVALSSLLFFMQLSVYKLWIFVSSCFCLCWKDKSSLLLPAMHGIANFKFENSMALTSRAALANVYYIFIFSFQTILDWAGYACRYCSLVSNNSALMLNSSADACFDAE